MTKYVLGIALAICAFSFGCSVPSGISGPTPASGDTLGVKVPGTDVKMTVKSGGVSYGNIISTAPGQPNVQTFSHYIVVANYDLDITNMATLKKPMTDPKHVRVAFGITGEEGTNEKSPFEVGTYDVSAEKINRVRSLTVTTFVDGKEKEEDFDTMMTNRTTKGTIKITAVTDTTVSGEIDITEGDKSIKGNFTSKLPVKK